MFVKGKSHTSNPVSGKATAYAVLRTGQVVGKHVGIDIWE